MFHSLILMQINDYYLEGQNIYTGFEICLSSR